MDKLKKPQDFELWAKSEYVQIIAKQIQQDIHSTFGMLPNLEVGGFSSDDIRPIKIYYFGTSVEIQVVKKYIRDRYDLGTDGR